MTKKEQRDTVGEFFDALYATVVAVAVFAWWLATF